MIKLTVIHYKLKESALKRHHLDSINNEKKLNEYDEKYDQIKNLGIKDYEEYPTKPFIKPFEFEEEDYETTELQFRIRPDDIMFYKTNLDGLVDISISETLSFTVKESIEEIDNLIKNNLN